MKPARRKVRLADSAAAVRDVLRAAGHPARPAGMPRRGGELILGGGGFVDLKDRKTQHFGFAAVDYAEGALSLVATTFLPHGVAIDPLHPARVVTFEKIGPGCAEIDLATGKVTRGIAPAPGRWFYGHGAFSPDGKLLYSTETVNDKETGVIGVRDARSLAYLGEFPTFGENPHDCHLIDGGRVMVVTNGGGALGTSLRPCVTYVEVETRRLLERLELASERHNTGHLSLDGRGGLAVVSAPRKGLSDEHPGAVSLRAAGEPLRTMNEPPALAARMLGEALSVEVHEPTGIAAVTHPTPGMMTFWSVASQALLKVLELPRPRGVTLSADGERFLVSYGESAELAEIDPATLELVPGSNLSRSFLTGSHLFNWNRLTGQAS